MMGIRLSVIIVSYNSLEYLKECISSIRSFNDIGESLEIIVVDNSTEKSTMDWLREQPGIVAISNENKGFGQGNNIGARVAKGEFLLFLNPDTVLIEPVFAHAIELFEKDSTLGLFGVQLVGKNRKRNSTYGLRMTMGLARTLLSKMLVTFRVFLPRKMYTSGADIFIRKNVFENAGCFDEEFFMYCEEADLCNRVNALGYKNGFVRNCKIIHLEGKTTEAKLFTSTIRLIESRKHYCEKYGYDFIKFLNKEKRYCRIKSFFFSKKGDQKRADEYYRIVEYMNQITAQG